MSKQILFKNAHIVDPANNFEGKRDVLVEGGKIAKIANKIDEAKLGKGAEILDCKGLVLASGAVDACVHFGEPGGSYKESLLQVNKAAIAGGVTSINLMPDTKPAIDNTAMVEFVKNRAKEKAVCNVSLFSSATKGCEGQDLVEIGLLQKAGAKGFSDCGKYIKDAALFRKICEYISNFDGIIASQPDNTDLSNGAVANEGAIASRLGLKATPELAEKIGLIRDLEIAGDADCKYHALGISTVDACEVLKQYRKKSSKISASTTINHVCLTEKEIDGYRTYAKFFPPLRNEKSRKAVAKAVKEGVVDFITSNHSPRSEDQKRQTFQSAECGGAGLETFISAAITYLGKEGFALTDIFRAISLNPAKFLQLDKKGSVCEGWDADLVLLDVNYEYKVNSEKFCGKAKNSPFDDKMLKGKIIKTYINGRIVYENK